MHKTSFFSVLFVVMVLSCGRVSDSIDNTLLYIDSLLAGRDEQKALQCVSQLSDSMMTDSQKAYYYLLLTQARYKNDVVATQDDEINFSVRYYADSKDENKYMRSLLYQGAVSEELGHLDKAVDCYHQVECMAAELDSFHLAYSKMRMAFLYLSYPIGANTIALNKFVEAERIYNQLGDKRYRLLCLVEIGGLYRGVRSKSDSAIIVLNKAFRLAKELNNEVEMFCIKHTIGDYYRVVTHQPDSSIKYALEALKYGVVHPRAHYALASSYSEVGKIDSAQYFLAHAPTNQITLDSITYFWANYKLATAKHDYEAALKYYLKSDSLSDSLFHQSMNSQLLAVEKQYDKQSAELENVHLQSELKTSIIVAVALVCLALLLVLVVWRYRNRAKMKAQEYELMKLELASVMKSLNVLQQSVADYESQLASAQGTIEKLYGSRDLMACEVGMHETQELKALEMKKALDHQIGVVQQLIQWSYEYENDGTAFVKRFRSLMTMDGANRGNNYWSNLHLLVNELYDNVLDHAQELAGGKLTGDEVNFLALSCCGYTRTVMMICMGYKNLVSVSNKKSKIAKKMGVGSLDAFVQQYCERSSY